MTTEEKRCALCGWPLAQSAEDGCTPGNCSMRPCPETPWQVLERHAGSVEGTDTVESLRARVEALGPLVEAALAYQHANDALALDVIARNRALLRAARAYREAAPRLAVDGDTTE